MGQKQSSSWLHQLPSVAENAKREKERIISQAYSDAVKWFDEQLGTPGGDLAADLKKAADEGYRTYAISLKRAIPLLKGYRGYDAGRKRKLIARLNANFAGRLKFKLERYDCEGYIQIRW